MSNQQSFRAGGHPVQRFKEILSFDNPACQGWTTDSKLTELAAKCQGASAKALKTANTRKEAKAVETKATKAAFEEEKRKWRKVNGLKVDAGPPPKKTDEDIEWAKMWMREEGKKQYQERKNKRAVNQELRENARLLRKGHEATKNLNEEA